jgi:hypothetical protein
MEANMKSQKLRFPDEYWAVFNCHVNNTKERALAVVRARVNDHDNQGLIELEEIIQTGIMAMFQQKITPTIRLFAYACFIFANELDKIL